MKIILMSRYFPPEIGTAANLFYELANGLSKKGHDVTVITNFPWYNLDRIPEKYQGKFFMREDMADFRVIRVAFPIIGPKKLKLAIGHITSPFISLIGGCMAGRPDIIFAYSPPLFMGISGWILKYLKKAPFVFGVQDLHPQCYIDQGVLKNRLLILILESLEKFCYKHSSIITVHSEGNKDHIVSKKGAMPDKTKVIPNWIDLDEMKPLPRENEFSTEHDLNKKFIVGYAGTLGMSQGLMSIIDAAYLLKDIEDIEFFIVGDGIEKEKMLDKTKSLNLKNIRFLGMQSKKTYPYVVASSDVQLVTLNKKVQTPVVPSKILSTMAAARPVLASMPLDGDAPKLIEEAKCGICIGPESPDELAEKIIYLYKNRELCESFGRNGLNYVTSNLSLDVVMKSIEKMFEDIIKVN